MHFREWDESKENDWFLLTYPLHDAFHNYFARLGEFYQKEPALHADDYQHNPREACRQIIIHAANKVESTLVFP